MSPNRGQRYCVSSLVSCRAFSSGRNPCHILINPSYWLCTCPATLWCNLTTSFRNSDMHMHEGCHGCCTNMCLLSLQKTTDMELSSHTSCGPCHVHQMVSVMSIRFCRHQFEALSNALQCPATFQYLGCHPGWSTSAVSSSSSASPAMNAEKGSTTAVQPSLPQAFSFYSMKGCELKCADNRAARCKLDV